jgi:lipopolysaccharide biosynthesis glycosyltransferase
VSVSGSRFALVFAADEGFALPLAVAMRSALASLTRPVAVDVYVLDNGLSAGSRARLRKVADATRRGTELRWLSVPAARLANIVIADPRFTAASYARLFAAELVPENVERVVYLDADVLVRQDVSPLFTIDLGDAAVGAVRDFGIPTTAHELSGVRERLRPRTYFNAGVLAIDVRRWRQLGLTSGALSYAEAGSEPPPLVDQDALNAVVDSWHELDARWNVQQILFWEDRRPRSPYADDLYRRRSDLYRGAAVLHFVGGPKPWHPACTLPGATAWVRTMMRTGWHSRSDASAWLLRYLASRARYCVGTMLRRWRVRRDPRTTGQRC